jgi:SAM-dependent methyltransferase
MSKSAPLRWLENQYLRQYLRGRGMEVGALWRRFPVHPSARVWYVDHAGVEDLKRQHADLQADIFWPDVLADAVELPVAPGSLDFLIASHVLEHLPFTLQALKAWYLALAPGGVLLVKVPDKRYSFDKRRDRTPLAKLKAEFERPESFDWLGRYLDWVQKVDGRTATEEELRVAVPGLQSGEFNIHYQVWIDEDLFELVRFTQREWGFDWKLVARFKARFYRKEALVLLRRKSERAR